MAIKLSRNDNNEVDGIIIQSAITKKTICIYSDNNSMQMYVDVQDDPIYEGNFDVTVLKEHL